MSKTGEVMNDICIMQDTIVESMENLVVEATKASYEQGWRAASEWAKRDDLVFDIGSPAYDKDRKFRLAGV